LIIKNKNVHSRINIGISGNDEYAIVELSRSTTVMLIGNIYKLAIRVDLLKNIKTRRIVVAAKRQIK
jgi:hypothetical protein